MRRKSRQFQSTTCALIALLFGLRALFALAFAQAPVAVAPYRIDYDGWYTVSAMVNGEGPYDFIIDTGATATVVFQNLATLQAMPQIDAPPRRILGLVGSERLPVRAIGEVTLGPVGLTGLESVVIEDWPAPRRTPQGVIGLDLLSKFVLRFDARRQVIEFRNPGGAPDPETGKWGVGKLKADDFGKGADSLYRVNVDLQGRPISFVLDLGASGSIINRAALRRLFSGVQINGTRESGFMTGSRLNDIFGDDARALIVRIRTTSVGAARWRDREYVVFDAPVFGELGLASRPAGFFGSDHFVDRSFVIDFPAEKIYIGPASPRS